MRLPCANSFSYDSLVEGRTSFAQIGANLILAIHLSRFARDANSGGGGGFYKT